MRISDWSSDVCSSDLAEEYFSPGQKGSSAMPHKRNPILTENLTGLARIVRSATIPAMENVALWHERDISHSSVERFIGPDATITLDFALGRLTGEIGRASCRERVCQYVSISVVAVSLKKKNKNQPIATYTLNPQKHT